MSVGIDKLASELQKVIEEKDKNKKSPYDTEAEVVRVDSDVVWVKIPGGVDETPAQKTVNAKEGDKVQVRVTGGRAFLVGNGTNPPTDDTVANVAIDNARDANQNATAAGMAAEQAIESANTANKAATKAQTDAAIAHTAATEAKTDAADAKTAATEAKEDAGIAHTAATEAKADAADAKTAANEAKADAQAANTAATEAKADAARANTAANDSLSQLSIVEDVVGTLNWITTHATYKASADTEVHAGKWYFTKSGDTYNVVTNPTGNPSAKGYYEVDTIDEAVSNYIASHIALTSDGLYLTKDGSGYKILLANDGLKVYDPEGHLVSTFGESIILDSSRPQTIGNNNVYIKYYDKNNDGTPDSLAIKADEFLLSSGKTIQEELEGVENWFYSVAPTTSNPPASSWTTDKLKEQHLRDIYFDTTSGKSYRWAKEGTTYKWVEIEDVELAALAKDLHDNYPPRSEFTVAPDKIQSTVSAAQTAATNAANTATDNKLTSYSTTTQMNSAIEQKANSIALSVSEEKIAELISTKEVSGSIVHVEDASKYPALDCKISLEPIQDLNGYDKPWVGGAGKNRFDVDAWIALPRQTNWYSVADGVVSVNANDGSAITGRTLQFKPNTQYTISFTNPSSCRVFDESGNTIAQTGSQTSTSFTTTESGQIAVKFYGSTYPTVIGKVQIEEGSTATTWTPYSNICPISGWDSVEAYDTGVNVWDEEWRNGYYNSTTGVFASYAYQIANANPISVNPNTTYAVVPRIQIRFVYLDANKEVISISNAVGSITTPSNCHYINFNTFKAYGKTYNNDISINYPATDTDYHTYNGTTYTTSLGQTVYGGTLDVVSGVLTVDRAMVDLGNVTWNYNSTYSCWMTSAIANIVKKYPTQAEMITAIAEKYVVDPVGILSGANFTAGKFILGTSGNLFVKTGSNSETPTGTFVYELATPQTYQLTPRQVELLAGTNNLWSDSGDTYLKYITMNSDMLSLMDKSNADLSRAKAEIKVTTDGISSEVAKKVGDSEIISKINQSAETVQIEAEKIEFNGSVVFNAIKSQTDAAYDTKGSASEASKIATSYITDIDSKNGITIKAVNGTISGSNTDTQNYIKLNADGLDIYKGGKSVAKYGDTVRIGKSENAHIEMDYHSLQLKDKEGNVYFYVSDLRDAQGVYEAVETFTANGSVKNFTVEFPVSERVSEVDSSHSTNTATLSERTYTFGTTPSNGATITITYKTTADYIKAYTLGLRKAGTKVAPISVAEGYRTTASGYYSHAEGYQTTASADSTHAEGYETTASSYYSHAEGYQTKASSLASHAEGHSTTASGIGSHAEGHSTTASGIGSHAEGHNTTASQYYAHAEGRETTAGGQNSHSEGFETKASGYCSHAQNMHTIAQGGCQTVIGKWNEPQGNPTEYYAYQLAFIIGNGTAEDARSNAMKVSWAGNTTIAGTLTQSSDRRLKDHKSYLDEDAVEFIDNLKPAHFFKDGQSHVGFYAQDVKEADKWNCMTGEMNGYMTLGYMELIAPLVTYCQHLEKRINELENKMKEDSNGEKSS